MHRMMFSIARAMALFGGAVLVLLILVTCVSIIGRTANTIGHSEFTTTYIGILGSWLQKLGPINGDYELVEAGIAFSIFAFLPWCQLNRRHANVEILTGLLPPTPNRFLAFVWEALFAFIIVLIAWRLAYGLVDKMKYNETSFLLQFPIWWSFAASLFAATIAAIVSLYSAWLHFQELVTGKATDLMDGSAGI